MKRILSFLLAVCVILGLAGCIRTEHRPQKQAQWVTGSWEKRYASLRELTADSELIAIVTVQERTAGKEDALPSTLFTVKIHTLLWGAPLTDTFTVAMTGGEKDGVLIQVTDDPLMEKEEMYLLFCTENTDGTFRVLGGPQGRFRYQDGSLTPVYKPAIDILMKKQADADTVCAEIISYLTTS